jgi:hypothetical protein
MKKKLKPGSPEVVKFPKFTPWMQIIEKYQDQDHILLFESIHTSSFCLYTYHISKRRRRAKDIANYLLLAYS